MTGAQKRAAMMKKAIEAAAIACKMNLAICGGKIAFVDQEDRKIVALWEPQYTMSENKEEN